MLRTSPGNRALLDQAGYVYDATVGAWIRRGAFPGFLQGRMLDGAIAGAV